MIAASIKPMATNSKYIWTDSDVADISLRIPFLSRYKFFIAKCTTDWDFENSFAYEVKIPHHQRQAWPTQKETSCSPNS